MTRRTKYQGQIQVYTEASGRYYIYKWDGRQYQIDFVTDSFDSLISLTSVDFRVSDKDLGKLNNVNNE